MRLEGEKQIRSLLGQTNDPQVGYRASMLIGSLRFDQFRIFVTCFSLQQKAQYQVALNLLETLPSKLLIELERIERKVAKKLPQRVMTNLKKINDEIKKRKSYATVSAKLKALAQVIGNEDEPLKEEMFRAAEIFIEGIEAARALAYILLQSHVPEIRRDTQKVVESLGEFGSEILGDFKDSAVG